MPTQTFEIAVGADDQYISRNNSSVYPPNTTEVRSLEEGFVVAQRRRASISGETRYYVSNALLSWDTSSLPDTSTIVAATLRIYVHSSSNADARMLTAGWYGWNGSSASDYSSAAETTAIPGTSVSALPTLAYSDLALENFVGNISKTGPTKMRLHVSGGRPTGSNLLNIASFEHETIQAPQLVVSYTLPTSSTFLGGVS